MPIGFDSGGGGGGSGLDARTDWREQEREQARRDALDPWRDVREPVAPEAAELGFWAWVEVAARTLVPEAWSRWATVEDERVCPECGPLDGQVWPVGQGPSPPLHVNCRCGRVHAFTLWRVREGTRWELRWVEG